MDEYEEIQECFCLVCQRVINPVINEEVQEHLFWGKKFEFATQFASCPYCGEQFMLDDQIDYNEMTLRSMIAQRYGPYVN